MPSRQLGLSFRNQVQVQTLRVNEFFKRRLYEEMTKGLWTEFHLIMRFHKSRRKRKKGYWAFRKEKSLGLCVVVREWKDHTVQFYKVRG